MENDVSSGMKRKYTALRVGTIRNHPCVFYFVEGENKDEFFLVIDSKSETKTINVDLIDQFSEDEETGRLVLVYHISEDDKMIRKRDEYECAETESMLKTFSGLRNKIMGLGQVVDFTTIKSAASEIKD